MASSSSRGLAAAIAVLALTATNVVQQAYAHPNCINDFAPDLDVTSSFCPGDNVDGFCCTPAEETGIETNFNAAGVSGRCAEMYQEVLCGVCHPWSGHLYQRLGSAMTLTNEFCDEFAAECGTQLSLSPTYCDVHTGGDEDAFYAYPYVPDESFTGEGLVKAFPDVDDGDLPTNPLDMRLTPDGSKWWVLGLEGQIVEIDKANPSGTTLVMDVSSKIRLTFEEGLLSFAFTPGFHSTGTFFVSYTVTIGDDDFGSNRLSKFQYFPGDPAATSASEVEIILSSMKATEVHSAGWVGFKPSAYGDDSATATHELYWSMGDAGPQLDTTNNGQNPDTLHGSILRIVVDSGMGASYSVPGSNPFSGGGGRTEICAQGFRNPYKCNFDKDTDELYCADVGQFKVETIKIVECGNNYGWRQLEGDRCTFEIEADLPEGQTCENIDRSPFTPPIFNYCHPEYFPVDEPDYVVPDANICGDRSIVGFAVIGGFVYRGTKYADLLYGNYVFGDFQKLGLHNLYPNGSGGYGSATILGAGFLTPTGFAEDAEGEIYVIQYKGSIYELPCGDICDGEGVNPVGQEPAPLPETPSPVTPELTPAPTPAAAETPAPTDAPVTPAPTDAPVSPAPTDAPVTAAPVTAAPLEVGETAAPSTASPTAAPATPAPTATPATPAPTAAPATPNPTAGATPSPEATVTTPAPVTEEPATPAPLFVRTHAPTATPEPTAPRTASPQRIDDDYVAPPIRTVTEPPVETPTTPAPVKPVAPVPVTPEDPAPPAPQPTTVPREPTPVPETPTSDPVAPPREPTVPSPTPFVCDGLLSPLGQYCCPSGCGECGGVGCSGRPGGQGNCCTSSIKDLCAVTGAAPCHIPPEDVPVPAPAPSPVAPVAPMVPPTTDRLEPGTEPLIPKTPGSAVPPVSPEDHLFCGKDYGEDVVPMSGPEVDPVSPPEYLGCFIDNPSKGGVLTLAYNASDAMTPTWCATFCADVGGDMFGLQHGRQCMCGDSRDADVEKYGRTTECDMPCSGDDTVTCGGDDHIDAYYIGGGPKVPEGSVYVGCHADSQQERAVDEGFLWCDGTMTVPLCEQYCRSRKAVVYGVQYGHECWCGDHMDYDQYGPGVCDYRCTGDKHTTCGGHTAQNVYTLHY